MSLGSEAEFWATTPRMFGLAVEGRGRARQAEHAGRMSLAWHTEALARTKRLPDLGDLIGQPKKPAKPKSGDELFAIAQMWDAAVNARPGILNQA